MIRRIPELLLGVCPCWGDVGLRRTRFLFLAVVLFVWNTAAFAEPVAARDPAALFSEYCGHCHASPTFAPPLSGLANMTAEEIRKELWSGVMAEYVNGIEDGERQAIAEWIADQKPDKDTRESGVPMCAAQATFTPNPAQDWPGLSNDNRFNRHVADAKLSREQVEGIKLKWAVAFPHVHSKSIGRINHRFVCSQRAALPD